MTRRRRSRPSPPAPAPVAVPPAPPAAEAAPVAPALSPAPLPDGFTSWHAVQLAGAVHRTVAAMAALCLYHRAVAMLGGGSVPDLIIEAEAHLAVAAHALATMPAIGDNTPAPAAEATS